MLDDIREHLALYHDAKSFRRRLDTCYEPLGNNKLVFRAVKVATKAFPRQAKRSEGRYFKHLYGVPVILLSRKQVHDPNLIAAAVLHDMIELFDDWDYTRIHREFNRDVADLVSANTKSLDVPKGADKGWAVRGFHRQLDLASDRAVAIKIADRLHNLLTQSERRKRDKWQESRDFYLPLAQRRGILADALEAVIVEIEAS